MSTIVIYPNNSVSVNGYPSEKTVEDLKRLGIPLLRVGRNAQEADGAERRRIEGNLYIIFPTHCGAGRARRTTEGRQGCRLVKRIGGELRVQCLHCGHMKREAEFPRHRGTILGIDSWCKQCHNATNRDRKRRIRKERGTHIGTVSPK